MDVTVNVSALVGVMEKLAASVQKKYAEEARAARQAAARKLKSDCVSALNDSRMRLETVAEANVAAAAGLQRDAIRAIQDYFETVQRIADSMAADNAEFASIEADIDKLARHAGGADGGSASLQKSATELRERLIKVAGEENSKLQEAFVSQVHDAEGTVRHVIVKAQETIQVLRALPAIPDLDAASGMDTDV